MHELKKVLVHRDDDDVEAGRRRLRGERSNHVVGFVALGREDRHAERLARRVHHRNLLGELVGHRRAVRLVIGDEIVAEGASRQIERRRDVLRLVLGQQLPQHGEQIPRSQQHARGAQRRQDQPARVGALVLVDAGQA